VANPICRGIWVFAAISRVSTTWSMIGEILIIAKTLRPVFQRKEPTEVRCRLCDLNRLLSVLDLGATQLYEKFLTADELALSPEF
jgi:hypothetical protein